MENSDEDTTTTVEWQTTAIVKVKISTTVICKTSTTGKVVKAAGKSKLAAHKQAKAADDTATATTTAKFGKATKSGSTTHSPKRSKVVTSLRFLIHRS